MKTKNNKFALRLTPHASLLLFAFSTLNFALSQVPPGSVVEENVDNFLSTPAENYIKEIPVIIIRYLPTNDGINIDVAQATDYWNLGEITIDDLKSNVDKYDKRVKFMLEEGSRFHGYKDPNAIPYLGYKVIRYLSVYRQIYVSDFTIGTDGGKNLYQPDYKREFDSLDLTGFINENQVKEVWMWYGEAARPGWPSYDPALHGNIQEYVSFVESNMASPSTGDVSNSYLFPDDLYILDSTYMVYCQNFRRTQAEAVHNHGHQLESIYKYIANRQDGNIGMFVQNFCGWGDNNYTIPPIGRAGDTHHPPNTTSDYDYLNTSLVESDIEDWQPLGGPVKAVNVDTWGNLEYNWPGDPEFSQRIESQWYIYWMQNMPGYQNNIPYNSYKMTNWWQFTAIWDICIANNIGLYGSNTGIAEDPEQTFTVFPNPTRGKFQITSTKFQTNSKKQIQNIEVVDLFGNIMDAPVCNLRFDSCLEFGACDLEFNISSLPSGVYFCRIQSGNQKITKKIILIK